MGSLFNSLKDHSGGCFFTGSLPLLLVLINIEPPHCLASFSKTKFNSLPKHNQVQIQPRVKSAFNTLVRSFCTKLQQPPIFNIKKIANKNSINGTLKSEICCNSYFVFKQISAVLIKLLQIVLIKLFAITQHLKYQFTLRNFGADWA
jgi:hypothetical protein